MWLHSQWHAALWLLVCWKVSAHSRSVLLSTECLCDDNKYLSVPHFSIFELVVSISFVTLSFLSKSSLQFLSLGLFSLHQTVFLPISPIFPLVSLSAPLISHSLLNFVFLPLRFYLYLSVSFNSSPALATIPPSITFFLLSSSFSLFPSSPLSPCHILSHLISFASPHFCLPPSHHSLYTGSPPLFSASPTPFLTLIFSAVSYFNHSACGPWHFQREDPPEGSQCVSNAQLRKPSSDSLSVPLSVSGSAGASII